MSGMPRALRCIRQARRNSQLSDKALLGAGITPDLVRLSIGLESVDDIIEDIDQALDKIR